MATPLVCGSCGAPLPIEGGEVRAKCPYCGATSQLSGHPARPPESRPPEARPAEPEAPQVVERHPAPPPLPSAIPPTPEQLRAGRRVAGGIGCVALGIPLGIAAILLTTIVIETGPGQYPWDHMQWNGTAAPILVDLDGDGTAEILGLVRFLGEDESVDAVAAFDATNGHRRWVTKVDDASGLELAVLAGKIWLADDRGRLRGVDPKTGAFTTLAGLGEKPDEFCGDGDGGLVLHLTNQRILAVNLATGQLTDAGTAAWDTPCRSGPWTSKPGTTPTTTFGDHFHGDDELPDLPGLSLDSRLRDEAGGVDYLLGRRSPGTGVPVVVARDRLGAIRWTIDAPSGDVLLAEEGEPEAVGLYGGSVYVPWGLRDGDTPGRVSAFDAATGRRRWDAVLPDSDTGDVRAIAADGQRVYVSTWTWLHVLDAATGKVEYTLGVW